MSQTRKTVHKFANMFCTLENYIFIVVVTLSLLPRLFRKFLVLIHIHTCIYLNENSTHLVIY